jgi:hypothetical protein
MRAETRFPGFGLSPRRMNASPRFNSERSWQETIEKQAAMKKNDRNEEYLDSRQVNQEPAITPSGAPPRRRGGRALARVKAALALAGLAAFVSSAAFGQTQLIVNGSFDSPNNGEWQILGNGASIQNSTTVARSDGGYLSMGNVSSVSQSAYQTITLPTNTVAATLWYYYNIYSTYPNSGDILSVYIVAASGGATLVNQINNSFSDPVPLSANYHPVSITNLAAWAGQTVEIYFQVQTDANGSLTSFNIDDVSVWIETTADIPANDYFANRTALTGAPLIELANNTFATKEPGEPKHAGNAGGHSLWWSWTSATNGTVTLNTLGSGLDTLLAVYTGSSVSNLTKVASDNALNESSDVSQVRFLAAAGTEYEIAIDGANGEYGAVVLNLSFQDDTKAPTISISSPASGAKVTNSTVLVKGTASDNFGVAQVEYRLENINGTNDWQVANGTNKWSCTISNLAVGLNTVRARAYDNSGNVSALVARSFTYNVVSPFTLNTTGSGAVSPKLGGQLLVVGQKYTLTASPGTGFVFSNWVDSASNVLGTAAKLTFPMQSNLVLQANFVPNPFSPVQGNYAGLSTATNGVDFTNSGFFAATLAGKGAFSAKLQLAGGSYSLSGQFSAGGAFSNSIARKGTTPLSVQLQLDFSGGQIMNGQIGSGAWNAKLAAYRAVYSKTNSLSQTKTQYTLLVQPGDDSLGQPAGYGVGAFTVDTLGNVSFSGTLADGAKVAQKTFLSKDGQWPLYLSTYSSKGAVWGLVNFNTNLPEADLSGSVNWFRPAQNSTPYKSALAITSNLQVLGSTYIYTKGVPLFGSDTNLVVVLTNGGLSQSITTDFVSAPNGKVTSANKSTLTVTTSSGLFRGSIVNPPGKAIAINGALFQKQTNGFGYFLGATNSGSVYFGQ